MTEPLPIHGLDLSRDARVMHLWSQDPLAVLSSAVVGSEWERTRHVVNMHVERGYDNRTPSSDLQTMARELGIREPFVGLMTAARLERGQVVAEEDSQTTVVAIVTVGVSHPVAAGVTDAGPNNPGTINMILVVDAHLSRAAHVNAVITATEAKTLALVESGIRAPHGGFASGTGTDAIVVATTARGASFEYAGPISPAGVLIARAVRRAVQNALRS